MKTISVVGTRPEAIKMAPVMLALDACDDIENIVVATGQHREMADDVLGLFGIEPDHDFDLMTAGQTPSDVAAAVIARLAPLLRREAADWLLVQGDTTTTMAAALAGAYAGTGVAHVEAGLRTHDRRQPFPEEINRRVTAAVANLHFAPTRGARENLLREGVPPSQVRVTGNPVIDALRAATAMPRPPSLDGLLASLPVASRLILLTAHRRENFGDGLAGICEAVTRIHASFEDIHVVYPVHRNPNVQGPVTARLASLPRVHLVAPLDYCAMAHLLRAAWLVLTDSGGLQEEAPSLGRPVLVLRRITERPEAVEAGAAALVGTDPGTIVAAVERLRQPAEYDRMARAVSPYGDGRAADRIARLLRGLPIEEFDAG